ncbi:TonB family protein [Paucibacter sp. DJ2R-2]|uniref:TonB family protein n=1 Tax=Paucibacter sp. DJ2R-2 TaxID=2893558 RepID=UPI0021E42020|nr:TonB family protein [Paucibacter sp. DJ2R-2]MCV2421699.1 TonB family protein [Paucibacter sp. DJ4R-1]MCV2438404.1 TonB family protein [Paucibacter sp. DJ2R-2]
MNKPPALATPRRPAVLGLVLTAHLSGVLGLAWALHGRPANPPAVRPMTVAVSLLPQRIPQAKDSAPAPRPGRAPRPPLAAATTLPVLQAMPQAPSLVSAPVTLEAEASKARADLPLLAAVAQHVAASPVSARPKPAHPVDTGSPAQLPAEHGDCAARQAARLYPAALRERGIEGQVLLRVQVAEDGRAAEVRVQRGSGWRLLDQAAQALALACRYVPAQARTQEQLQALSSWVEVPVRFALQHGSSTSNSGNPTRPTSPEAPH